MSWQDRKHTPIFVLLGILIGTGAIYYPALDSLFLLDDLENLRDLAEIPGRGLSFYLFGSSAGPGGRPLSLLSFALQYPSWPLDPFSFKLVNLLLHLTNGVLVFVICRRLFQPNSSLLFACLVTAIWLIHPLHLTTVLYVVQRMSILSATFILTGILLYLRGREIYLLAPANRIAISTGVMVYLVMTVAILAKESGILLTLYLLVLEFTLLQSAADIQRIRPWRIRLVPVLILPLLLLTAYLFRDIDGFFRAYDIREFSLGQRLLTEANVLLDYLKLVLLPVSGAFSVFHDDYTIATHITNPPRTMFSLLALISLLSAALYYRKRAKVFSFAVFWFLAGHLLESSFIPLELYFEHRNYLPSLGIIILIVYGLVHLPDLVRSRQLQAGVISLYMVAILLVTVLEVNLWRQPQLQAYQWALQHPGSKRALNHWLNINLIVDDRDQVNQALARLRELDGADLYPMLKTITIRNCYDKQSIPPGLWEEMYRFAASTQFRGTGAIGELDNIIYLGLKNSCTQLEKDNLSILVDNLLANPEFQPVKAQLYDQATNLALIRQKPAVALQYINSALTLSGSVDRSIVKLKILLALGQVESANQLLQQIRHGLRSRPGDSLFYRDQLQAIEQSLLQLTRPVR
jgi:hypothetical protein